MIKTKKLNPKTTWTLNNAIHANNANHANNAIP